MDVSKALRKHLAALGKKGGEAGKGDAKRRSPAHYKRIAKLAVEARRAKRDSECDRSCTHTAGESCGVEPDRGHCA